MLDHATRSNRFSLATGIGVVLAVGMIARIDSRLGVSTTSIASAAVAQSTQEGPVQDRIIVKKADFNPECVGCHVVGFKKRGGFADNTTTPALANVQCEACHGPGTKHLQNPALPYGKAGKPACMPCHTHDNSPSFDFDTYWPRIRHGA